MLMNHPLQNFVAFSALSALLGVSLAGCGHQAPAHGKKAPEQTPVKVQVALATQRPWPSTVRVQGSLMSDEQAVVGVKVAGLVRKVAVDLGSPVEKGQSLCMLDREEFELRIEQCTAQLAQARAKLGLKPDDPDSKLNPERAPPVLQERAVLEEARSNLARAKALEKRSAISVEEVQQREAAVRVSEARLSAAFNSVDQQIAELGVFRAQLSLAKQALVDSEVLAPFSGVVAERHAAPGVFLQVGQRVVTLVRTDPLRFRAGIPEREAQQVQLGQEVTIRLDGQSAPVIGKVDRISPSLDPASRSLAVEVDVPNPGGKLRAGLFAEAEIVVDPRARTLAVPKQAIREFAGVEKVWVVADGKAEEMRVQTGRRYGDYVEILSGLQPEAVVAVTGRLSAGRAVTITNPSDAAHHAE
jgi:RND family efflux transporter MFP subunit